MQTNGIDPNMRTEIKSMTGFGSGRAVSGNLEIVTEIKAVNHRFFEIFFKLPKIYSGFEHSIRRLLSEHMSRGKFDVTINRIGDKGAFLQVNLDEALARNYYNCLMKLKETFGITDDVKLSDMLTLKDIVQPVEQQTAIEEEWPVLEESVKNALQNLNYMRTKEGEHLWRDIESRLDSVKLMLETVRPLVQDIAGAARDRIAKRVQELTSGLQLDEDRLLQEVAIIAEKSDVTEEMIRMNSHLQQFKAFGMEGSPLGRKLDFLLQELNREINTLGSKAASTSVSPIVVNMKSEMEKIREQVQNIE